ncbi:hypothetical protein FHS90_002677 [Rufibacter quisquiliarum]|uniref:Uncharacterized protein n=1 Tax=Rufibacter quisquiliarum TaxID=1549639 RepID=A0A839GEC2_9BACT|nr:hypothetical protein [Rufibacter quisquiliarum]
MGRNRKNGIDLKRVPWPYAQRKQPKSKMGFWADFLKTDRRKLSESQESVFGLFSGKQAKNRN